MSFGVATKSMAGFVWLGLVWPGPAWLGLACRCLARVGLACLGRCRSWIFCQMASPYRILQNQVRSLRAAVSWLSKSKTGFLTLQLVTFSKDPLGRSYFWGVTKKTHSAAEGRMLILPANFRGCGWASRAGVIHGRCEDGAMKVLISRRRNDRFWRSPLKVYVSRRRIKCFSEACQMARLAGRRAEPQPRHSPGTAQPQPSHSPATAQSQPSQSPATTQPQPKHSHS